jgi:hypothetical protein
MKNGAFKLPEKDFRPLYQEAYRTSLAAATMIRADGDRASRKKTGYDKTKTKAHPK